MMSNIINNSSLQSNESFDFIFKIVLIGDCSTGKSCIVERFRNGTYNEPQPATVGVDFSIKTVCMHGKTIKLQIWDTAGMERFRTVTQSYYRSANGVIIVYDTTKRATFLNVQKWIDEARRNTGSNVLLFLVGTKCDLEDEREVELSEAEEMRDYIPEIMFVLETSAKENKNIDDVFFCLAEELKKKHDQMAILENAEEDRPVNISESKPISQCALICD
ncbi:hypothetical protein PGB90_004487 [Kerria lacca]